MKNSIICLFSALLLAGATAQAGNDQKRGQVGATQLQINPWARSSGMAGANTARIRGVEAVHQNIGGLAFVKGTEINFATSKWLTGTDININAFGLTTKTADIEISGSGKCEVSVSDKLEAKLSGSGRVRYKGNPVVSTNISGSGSVVQVD